MGVLGLWWEVSRELFIVLVPLHLAGVTAIAFWGSGLPQKIAIPISAAIVLAGYSVEFIGVHTGFPFGSYKYLDALGPKIADIPPVIGINWLLLVITSSALASKATSVFWPRVFLAATLMTGLDFLIEPIALQYRFWEFANNLAPWNNYVAWWAISLVFCAVYQKLAKEKNKIPLQYLYLLQVGFFTGLHLLEAAF